MRRSNLFAKSAAPKGHAAFRHVWLASSSYCRASRSHLSHLQPAGWRPQPLPSTKQDLYTCSRNRYAWKLAACSPSRHSRLPARNKEGQSGSVRRPPSAQLLGAAHSVPSSSPCPTPPTGHEVARDEEACGVAKLGHGHSAVVAGTKPCPCRVQRLQAAAIPC